MKVKAGDEESFAQLVKEFEKVSQIYVDRYCLLFPKYLERKELYQLALLSLYKSALSYDPAMKVSFSTYFSVLLERDVLMHIRSINRDKNKSNLYAISLDSVIDETDGIYLVDAMRSEYDAFDPEKSTDTMLFYQCVKEALKHFSTKEIAIFKMWAQGYSYSEICAEHNVNRKRVEYILRKIKAQLRPSLEEWHKD